jgi:hypothetical protein
MRIDENTRDLTLSDEFDFESSTLCLYGLHDTVKERVDLAHLPRPPLSALVLLREIVRSLFVWRPNAHEHKRTCPPMSSTDASNLSRELSERRVLSILSSLSARVVLKASIGCRASEFDPSIPPD